ncbi:MAG TPA: hypothetical protein VJ043_01265 [Candidatus Paceibacterota bacterium]|nr:hypothetical protein [Candidatus Paceibacterota bacterium]
MNKFFVRLLSACTEYWADFCADLSWGFGNFLAIYGYRPIKTARHLAKEKEMEDRLNQILQTTIEAWTYQELLDYINILVERGNALFGGFSLEFHLRYLLALMSGERDRQETKAFLVEMALSILRRDPTKGALPSIPNKNLD